MTRLWLVRHGESLLNAAGRLQGWSDAPLTDRGRAQARERGLSLAAAGVRFDAVQAADGIRHRETARDVLDAMGERMPVIADPRWRELCFGAWEGARGHRFGRLLAEHGEVHAALVALAAVDPAAEHPDAVVERTLAALTEAADAGDEVLVVTSGLTILLLLDALGADLSHLEAGPAHLSVSTLHPSASGSWRVTRAAQPTL